MRIRVGLCAIGLMAAAVSAVRAEEAPDRKAEYVRAVTRGAGLMPLQDRLPSEAETAFRAKIEARKDALCAGANAHHPVLYDAEALATARRNVTETEWGRRWLAGHMELADYAAAQDAEWIEVMIPREAPSHSYGLTCPNCVGDKSQEATGYSLMTWSHKAPEQIVCRKCGAVYPNQKEYPESSALHLPRLGYQINYYLNDAERAAPDDRTGKLAWHWVGHPIHVSFTGIIRVRKIRFMQRAAFPSRRTPTVWSCRG